MKGLKINNVGMLPKKKDVNAGFRPLPQILKKVKDLSLLHPF